MTVDLDQIPVSKSERLRTKKPYITPVLVVHGAVEKITENTGRPGQADGLGTTRSA
jgi:hypothetical protein